MANYTCVEKKISPSSDGIINFQLKLYNFSLNESESFFLSFTSLTSDIEPQLQRNCRVGWLIAAIELAA